MDLVWAAAVLGTEFTCGHIWQDKSLLPAFPVPLREPSAALHVGLHSVPLLHCPWCPFFQ